jgi:hypothetical protein
MGSIGFIGDIGFILDIGFKGCILDGVGKAVGLFKADRAGFWQPG